MGDDQAESRQGKGESIGDISGKRPKFWDKMGRKGARGAK